MTVPQKSNALSPSQHSPYNVPAGYSLGANLSRLTKTKESKVPRPSDPILKWFRDMMNERGINVASLANSTNLPKADVRKALSGQSDMTLDQLIQFSEALGLSQEELVALDLRSAQI